MAVWARVFVSFLTVPSELPLQLCPFCPPAKPLGQPFVPPCLMGRDLQDASPRASFSRGLAQVRCVYQEPQSAGLLPRAAALGSDSPKLCNPCCSVREVAGEEGFGGGTNRLLARRSAE